MKDVEKRLERLSVEKRNDASMLNIDKLIDVLCEITFLPERKNRDGLFLFSVDHCFGIKGQGTVLTGTVLNGQVKINDVNNSKCTSEFYFRVIKKSLFKDH